MSEPLIPALHWITSLLKKNNIPFQITGGLAAHIYGCTRPVADIDIDVAVDLRSEKMKKLLPEIEPYLIFGPERYRSDTWDLALITLNYQGQEIDLCEALTAKIFNKNFNCWENYGVSFETAQIHKIFGLEVPVISREHLIDYKTKLAREVDVLDIEVLAKK